MERKTRFERATLCLEGITAQGTFFVVNLAAAPGTAYLPRARAQYSRQRYFSRLGVSGFWRVRVMGQVERGTGFEPATTCLEGRNSTTELPPRCTGV